MPVYDQNSKTTKPAIAPKQPQKVNPNPVAPKLADIKVDSKLFPRSAILAHVSGSRWVPLAFYSQFLNVDNNPQSYSADLPAVSQQYKKIVEPELRVQQALSHSFTDGVNEWVVTGSAIIYCGLIPNVGDLFLADIGDGRTGQFNVTRAEPKSYLQATVYEIEYKLIDYATPALLADLDAKTIETGYYVRDQYLSGNQAILVERDVKDYEALLRILETLPNEYHRDFFSREFQTYLVPDQEFPLYDPFITPFFKRLVNPDTHSWISKVNILNVDTGNDNVLTTVLDAALENDESIIDRCQAYVYPTNVKYFTTQALFGNIRYSGIEFVMFPKGVDVWHYEKAFVTVESFKLRLGPNLTLNRKTHMTEAFSTHNLPADGNVFGTELPWIHPNAVTDTYIFSPSFYEQRADQSAIELLFRSAVNGKIVDAQKLIKACGDRILWTSATRFYYIPILMYCIRSALANIG